jgi:sugar/nucleoside kinase (ribokinase family)
MVTLCLGEALVDLVCEHPVADLAGADAFVPHPGGAVANVAVTAARHGARVALAGGAGDDPWGAWLRARLEAERVDLRHFALLDGVQTPVAFVTVGPGGEPDFQIYGAGIAGAVGALAGRIEVAVGGSDALFIASNTLVGEAERAVTLAAREHALAHDKPVVFDPNLRVGRWPSAARAAQESLVCVPGAFLVKLNREEARLLTGERDPEAAAASLLAAGARHVVVTLGAQGALLRGGGLRFDAPGVPAQTVNAAGAGDALAGVLLARLAETDFYAPALAAGLPAAVAQAARATERWGALA